MIRYIIAVLAMFFWATAYGQTTTNFGATRGQDTGLTKGQLKATTLTTSNSNNALAVGPTGVFSVRNNIMSKTYIDSLFQAITGGGVTLPQLTDSMKRAYAYIDSADSVLQDQIDVLQTDVTSTDSAVGVAFGAIADIYDSLGDFVPYTGATATLNMGSFGVTTGTVTATSSAGLHLHGTGGSGIMVGAGGGSNITFDGYPTTTAGDSVLTTNSTGGLLRYDLKGKLSNYLLKNDSITIYATQNGLDTGVRNTRNFVLSKGYGTGTVTTVSVTSANGFAGTVSNATTTPAITLTTTVNGIVKGNGTNLQPATAGTDYLTSSTSTTVITTTNFTTSYTIAATDSRPILITITAQAGDLLFNAPTGLTDGQLVLIRIKATGSSRALTWNSAFAPITGPNAVALPTTVTTTAPATIQFIYNSTSNKMNLAGYVTN